MVKRSPPQLGSYRHGKRTYTAHEAAAAYAQYAVAVRASHAAGNKSTTGKRRTTGRRK